MIDFTLTPELADLEARTESFVRDVVIPTRGTRARASTGSTTRSSGS